MAYLSQIDYIRALVEDYFEQRGLSSDYLVASFYMPIDGDDIDRYFDKYNDLLDTQNNTKYKAKVVITNNGGGEIANSRLNYLSSFGFQIRVECNAIIKEEVSQVVFDMIAQLRGKKFDVMKIKTGTTTIDGITIDTYKVVVVEWNLTKPNGALRSNLYLKTNTYTKAQLLVRDNLLLLFDGTSHEWLFDEQPIGGETFYIESKDGYLCEVKTNALTHFDNITKTYLISSDVKRYKCSIAFDEYNVDDPQVLNADIIEQQFVSGKATFVDYNVMLGNDLMTLDFYNGSNEYVGTLEPLGAPSTYDVEENPFQQTTLRQANHITGISVKREYTFIIDYNSPLLMQWYNLGQYGIGTDAFIWQKWKIIETNAVFGVYTPTTIYGYITGVKINETIGDTKTLIVSFFIGE